MAASSSSKLIHAMSYAINKYSNLPLLSRMHLYEALQHYIFSQDNRLTTLENKISQLETKLESFENHKSKEQQLNNTNKQEQ
jgi:hypothetical protein